MNRKIHPKLRKHIKKEYLGGATVVELAKKYQVTRQAISYNLKKTDTILRPARLIALYDSPSTTKRVIKLYQEGRTMIAIAKRENVTSHTIDRILKHNKITKHPKNMRAKSIVMPSDAGILGYIAGMFDGEGNLQFRDKHKKGLVGCKITIYSTTPGVVEWFQKTMNGGKVLWDKARVKRHGWKPIGSWCLYRAQDVASFLIATHPFLIIKKDDADKAIRLFSERFHIKIPPPQ